MGYRKKRIKPALKKEIAIQLQQTFRLSERRVCRLLKINRTFKRYQKVINKFDIEIKGKLEELALKNRRFGYKRLHILLKREGFAINHKKVYRLYKEAGLSIRKRKNKCPLQKRSKPLPAEIINKRWAMDFLSDSLANGKRFRILTVIDEATRECLALEADTCITGNRVVAVLNQLVFFRGLPQEILTDNGPEFTSNVLSKWSYEYKVEHLFIDPGKPIQNAHIESFNGRFREECLDAHWFRNLFEARTIIEKWKIEYNIFRPHSSLEYMTPVEYIEKINRNNGQSHHKLTS